MALQFDVPLLQLLLKTRPILRLFLTKVYSNSETSCILGILLHFNKKV